jgi:ATP-dependent DNA helicase RecG
LDATELLESDRQLFDRLRLVEGEYLKRAALLLFYPDPVRFASGAFVKLGFFRSESELAYHDEIQGDLFSQVRQTLDLLFTKYLKAVVTYDDIIRVEKYPVPREALREAVLNALVHRDYSVAAPVQIRVYEDRLVLVNPAALPEGWTLVSLLGPHYSNPFNPNIANVFFRAGEIEAWGRGIRHMFDVCKRDGTPDPLLRFDANGLWIEFPFSQEYLALYHGMPAETSVKTSVKTSVETPVETPVETSLKTPEMVLAILEKSPTMSLAEVARVAGKSSRAIERAVRKLREQNKLRYVGPKKGGHWEVLK